MPGTPPPLPTAAGLAAFLHDALGAAAYPAEERGGVFRPGDGRPVARLGVAVEPWAGLAAWAARARLDAVFLHRPWRLAAGALGDGVGVLWSHLPFDDRLTTGYNPRLADALGLARLEPLGAKDGRTQGMVGTWAPRPAAEAARAAAEAFGGHEAAVPGRADGPVGRVAVVGAMNDALVREAAARGAGLYVTGQLRAPAQAAVADTGLAVVAVGHARSEWWGARALAHLVAERWGGVRVRVAPGAAARAAGALALAAGLAAPRAGAAQAVRVTVREARAGVPVGAALVSVLDAAGRPVVAAATSDAGVRLFPLPGAGVYRAQVRRVGYRPVTSPAFTVGAADTVALAVAAPAEPVSLVDVRVTGRARCDVRRGRAAADDETLFAVWDQVRTAVALAAARAADGPPVPIRRYVARLAADGRTATALTGFPAEGVAPRPFALPPLDRVDAGGYIWRTGNRATFLVPDEQVLLSDAFAQQHCFRLVRGAGEQAGLLGVAFEPAPDRRVPEVAGTLWLDSARAALRYLDYWYVDGRLRPETRGAGRTGGEVHFARLVGGQWGTVGWMLRVPEGRGAYIEAGGTTATGLGGGVPGGASPGEAVPPALARLRGRVVPGAITARVAFDSGGAAAPRPRAVVGVRQRNELGDAVALLDGVGGRDNPPLAAARTLPVDGAGRATFADLPAGVYDVRADTGAGAVTAEPVRVVVAPGQAAEVVLAGPARPSELTAARALCGGLPARGRVVYGVVRGPDGRPAAGVTVSGEWPPRGDAPGVWRTRTGADGRYAFCAAPSDAGVSLGADDGRGNRTAGPVVVPAGAAQAAEQALALTPLGRLAERPPPPTPAPAPAADSAAADPPAPRAPGAGAQATEGDSVGRVVGFVTDSATGRPLAGAYVQFVAAGSLLVAAAATTDSVGAYRVGPLPAGTYLVGFLHPVLDGRGLDPVTVRAVLPGWTEVRLDLAAPARGPAQGAAQGPAPRPVRP